MLIPYVSIFFKLLFSNLPCCFSQNFYFLTEISKRYFVFSLELIIQTNDYLNNERGLKIYILLCEKCIQRTKGLRATSQCFNIITMKIKFIEIFNFTHYVKIVTIFAVKYFIQ